MKTDSNRVTRNSLFLPSLVVSNFAAGPITILIALLLVDMSKTFSTSVSVMGQINTSYSIAAFVFALLMGALSIRFNHKSLLVSGLLLIGVSALGCFLAPDFITILAFYSLSGIGYSMVVPMTFALIGEHYPLEKRANAVGWVIAAQSLVYVVGAPVIAIMSELGGWRFSIIGFVIPVLVTGLMLVFFGTAFASASRQASANGEGYVASFREILLNRSAVACLTGDMLRSAAFTSIMVYAISFAKQQFLVSTDFASLILLAGALCYALGSLASGSFVNRIGRKPSVIITALLSGAFVAVYYSAPSLWISVVLILVAGWFFGMTASAANSLTLEQVPKLRGTMMSVDSAVVSLGSAIGTAVGGLALFYSDYQGLGSVLGTMGILAAVVFGLLAKDPVKKQ